MAAAGTSIEQLRDAVGRRQLASVYLVLGGEAALRRRAFEILRQAFIDDAGEEPPGAVTRMDLRADGLDALLDEARSLPLFAMLGSGSGRLLWASDAEALEKVEDLGDLQRYLADPVAATCLVLEAVSLDKRRGAFKMLAAASTVVDCEAPKSEADVRRWIEATVKARGYSIEPRATVLLLELVGTAITVLEHELEKAMLFVGPDGGMIQAETFEGLLGRSRERTVFELTDALVAGDGAAAMSVLNMLIDDGEEPVRLLGMIAWITRQLVLAHDLGARMPERQALESLGGRWEQRRQLLQRTRKGSREVWLSALQACAAADVQIKRLRDSRLGSDRLRPARGVLEALCRQICAA